MNEEEASAENKAKSRFYPFSMNIGETLGLLRKK